LGVELELVGQGDADLVRLGQAPHLGWAHIFPLSTNWPTSAATSYEFGFCEGFIDPERTFAHAGIQGIEYALRAGWDYRIAMMNDAAAASDATVRR
ncbi:MAG: hypothetical protein ACE5GS_17680, partial [Kiloniellaceae bacterium]